MALVHEHIDIGGVFPQMLRSSACFICRGTASGPMHRAQAKGHGLGYSTCAPGPEGLGATRVAAVGDAQVPHRRVQDRDAGALVVHQEIVSCQYHWVESAARGLQNHASEKASKRGTSPCHRCT